MVDLSLARKVLETEAAAILALVRDAPELARPGPIGRWLTDLFNDWPGGSRPPSGPSTPTG